jgi:Holliday junction resolvase RusA-like endonuclease
MIQQKLKIRPLSVNKVWQGRRFKTKDYKNYEEEVLFSLKKEKMIRGYVEVVFEFRLKYHKTSDVDNFIKPLLDIIVKKGLIEDDRFIRHLDVYKYPAEKDSVNIVINKWE